MLQSISWSDFFTAVALLVAMYYAVSLLTFYRTEIADFLKGRNKSKEIKSTLLDATQDVMGTARTNNDDVPREDFLSEDIQFVSKTNDSAHIDSDSLLVGTVSDLLEEIRQLHAKISTDSKENVIPVFRELLAKYPQLINTQYQEAINLFLMNACQEQGDWELQPEEAESLWPVNNNN